MSSALINQPSNSSSLNQEELGLLRKTVSALPIGGEGETLTFYPGGIPKLVCRHSSGKFSIVVTGLEDLYGNAGRVLVDDFDQLVDVAVNGVNSETFQQENYSTLDKANETVADNKKRLREGRKELQDDVLSGNGIITKPFFDR